MPVGDAPEDVRPTLGVEPAEITARTWAEVHGLAREFADRLTDSGSLYQEQSVPMPGYLFDVEQWAARFRQQVRRARFWQTRLPVVAVDHSIPVPVNLLDFSADATLVEAQAGFEFNDAQLWAQEDAITSALSRMRLECEWVDVAAVQEFFRDRLRVFVTSRLIGMSLNPFGRATRPRSPGRLRYVDFRVHSQASGLRIRYAPCFLFDGGGTVFGYPSTPTEGPIPTGRFIFGGESEVDSIRWDHGEYEIPPAVEAHLVAV